MTCTARETAANPANDGLRCLKPWFAGKPSLVLSGFFCAISFLTSSGWAPDGTIDLAFTNGVFHHIPAAERKDCLAAVRRSLRPGGLFAFWENNPWNPGTRYVMSNCAFDENAITISPSEAQNLLSRAGFKILRMDSLFYFPRQLSFLRPVERLLRALPLGGQYLVLCEKGSG